MKPNNRQLMSPPEAEPKGRARYLRRIWIKDSLLCALAFSVLRTLERGNGLTTIFTLDFVLYAIGVAGIMSFGGYWMGRLFWKLKFGVPDEYQRRDGR